jgi:hypothetical protein
MRFLPNLIVFATFASSIGFAQTIAEDLAALPTCATGCLEPAITAIGCGQTDWTCICGQQAALKAKALTCIISACSTADALSKDSSNGSA